MRVWFVAVVTVLVACGGSGDSELSVADYRSAVMDAGTDAEIREVSDMLNDATAQPALLLNESWKSDMLAALETWHAPYETVNDLNPPPAAEDAHAAALLATECLSDAADQIEPKIESEDMELDSVAPLITSCGDLIGDMTNALDALPED